MLRGVFQRFFGCNWKRWMPKLTIFVITATIFIKSIRVDINHRWTISSIRKAELNHFVKEYKLKKKLKFVSLIRKIITIIFLFSLKNRKLSAFFVVDAFKYSKQCFIEIKRFRNKILSEWIISQYVYWKNKNISLTWIWIWRDLVSLFINKLITGWIILNWA